MREYARATETFIVNQIASLHRYTPTVLCRRRLEPVPTSTLGESPASVSFEGASPGKGTLQTLMYQHLRYAGRSERDFYCTQFLAQKAEIIHCHYATDARYFLGAVSSVDIPVVVSYYGYDVSSFVRSHWGLGRRYLEPLWRHPATHLAMTPQMGAVLEALGAPSDRIRVHHHGIDSAFWAHAVRTELIARPYILHVGSLWQKKGQHDLLRAYALVRSKHPETEIRLVGRGPEEASLRRLAYELGIEEHVTFVGHLPHGDALRSEYANATLFCHPSRTAPDGDMEGLPGTILEAMACRLAVVGTRHAGIPFAVREGETGWLVAERDVVSLADALDDALSSDAKRRAFGVAARIRVESEFDVRVQAGRLETLYDESVSGRTPWSQGESTT